MVSFKKKGKKGYLPLQNNGLGSSQENLVSPQNADTSHPKKKKRKKQKKKTPHVEPLTSCSAALTGSASSSDNEGCPKKTPKLTVKKKKIKCDKLLRNLLKKKRKLKLQEQEKKIKNVQPQNDEMSLSMELSENGVEESEPEIIVDTIIAKKKRKMLKTKSSGEDTVPLILKASLAPKLGDVNHKGGKREAHVNGTTQLSSIPDLPVAECRETFIQRFLESDTLIVVGETGCGKSTQIPQYLFKDCPQFFSYRGLAITQPRRVAAISLANRVSYELGTEVGDLVGFKVRFDKQTSDKTKITFLTDGYLMMDAIRDKLFTQYSVIIVDEAHERSVETDVVLSLLRNAQVLRKKRNVKKRLKLIVMSATLDVDKFKTFFDLEEHELTTKAVYIKGRPFSLQLNYLPREVNESHTDVTWITLLKLHMELPANHHILVFLTGKEEIDLIVARANAINQQKDLEPVFVCPLYAALSKEAQMKSFDLPPDGTRKIVVSTNLAETSLTIPGIRVVIDSGRVKSKYFEESIGMNVLRVQLVSKSQSNQRAGRAGREFDGSVYRLYTRKDYEQMEEFPPPEIIRSNLSRIILLAAVSLGISNFKDFPLPDRPTNKAIKYSLNELRQYGAIESNQQPLKLTRTARRLLSFPVELHLARVLYLAVQYQELSRICAIVAMSTVESIYNPDIQDGRVRHNKYQTLWAPEGDFITFWKIFKEFKKAKNKKSWCKEYGIQFRTMLYVIQVWRHLLTVCQTMELEDDERLSCGDAIDFNDKANLIFKTAFSHQVAKLSKTGAYYIVENQFDINIKFHAKIHPSSSVVARKPGRLMFTHLSLNEVDGTVYMHNCGVL